jgi:arylsulfatase A-like enzyme
MDKPAKAVVVLLDSLNRHMIGKYGGTEFSTPNMDRLAERAVTFHKHYTGSLPCMPARHDILVGSMDFLWRPWGSIELWERPVTYHLRRKGVPTMLFSDHPHLFEVGGENYHTDFMAWEYLRGHESDPWKTREDPSWVGSPTLSASTKSQAGRGHAPYDLSRTYFHEELDYPGPKTLNGAAEWLSANGEAHESFLLFVDEFDPHEPFDTPEPWSGMYDPEWEGEQLIWPPYAVGGIADGVLTEREGQHIRSNYGAKLSMIDHWFGKLLDVMDRDNRWQDTMLILCTDHGHYLGEKDIWGKPRVPQYETLGHTPLMIAAPGVKSGDCHALTTNVDINATLVDLFDVDTTYKAHGRSMLPLLSGDASSIREYALGGVYGQWVQITDGVRKYARAPVADGFPLSMWSNRWSTMPVPSMPGLRLPNPDKRAWLDFMPDSDVPVIRQPFRAGDLLPFWAMSPAIGDHYLFDLQNDPQEHENIIGEPVEQEMTALLKSALTEVDAPEEQFERLGLE